MKKNIFKILIGLMFLGSFSAIGQQDPMLSQYMFNGLMLNPAYSGSHKYWSSTLTYRNQWTGADFRGAPQTAVAAVDGPIPGYNMGLGLVLMHDRLGVTQQNLIQAVYSYHIKTGAKTKLSLGLSAGASQFSSRLTDVKIWDEDDVMYQEDHSKWLPKVGFGAYFYAENFYVGASIPTLFSYEKDKDFSMDLTKASFLRRHYLLTGGVVIPAGAQLKFKPSVLLKYIPSAPLEADINLSVVIRDQFWIGASYRTLDAVAIILEYQTKSFFRIGYSYDITTSRLRNYSKGSHEIMIGFDFGRDLIKVKTPRYF